MTDDLTIQELRQLVEQNPNNKSAQKRLIIKACAVGVSTSAFLDVQCTCGDLVVEWRSRR